MDAKPETKFSMLVGEINELLPPGALNEFAIRRVKREAQNLLGSDAYSSYILQGMIACLEADVKSVNKYHLKALKLTDNTEARVAYGSSLNNIGFYDDAIEHFKVAHEVNKDNISLLKHLLDSAIYSFRFESAEELLRDVIRMQPDFQDSCAAAHAHKMMKKFDISDEDTLPIRNAYSKVIEKGHRIWGANIALCEEDGFEWLDVEFQISAQLGTVVDMNFELAELIASNTEEKVMNHIVVRFSEFQYAN